MHYNLHYEITPEVSRLVTETMLRIYDEYKEDKKIFPKVDELSKQA